ncbi:hypothetical protein JD969_18550 [Planctomycetota bacterium]|nr:hypothetical protein JD969_18550 [Planctomycetota bacterium]
MQWCSDELVEIAANCLIKRALDDDLEQTVYGFDSLKELKIHTLLEEFFLNTNFGVWREVRYPKEWHKSKKSEGIRCDFVLTPDGLPLKDPELSGTLFGDAVESVSAEEAYWMEVKVVREFDYGQLSKKYSNDLKCPVKNDILKIWSDGRLKHGGLLLMLYTADQATGMRDVLKWYELIQQKGLPIRYPALKDFKITERTGNGWCTIALFEVE